MPRGDGGPERTILVTGASSGIGRATAEELARRGHRVLLVCRDRERGEAAREEIRRATGSGEAHLLLADLSEQAEIRRLAEEVAEEWPALDVLVNNAGTYARERRETPDGVELQLAVNHLAPFLLTRLLRPRLEAAAPARVVTVSSGAHRGARLELDDLQMEGRYDGWRQYCRTKLMNVLFTRELARRWKDAGISANALHPGVVETKLLRRALGPEIPAVSPEEGARTPVHLAVSPEVEGVTGRYFRDRRPVEPAPAAKDPEAARKLWERSEELTGWREGEGA